MKIRTESKMKFKRHKTVDALLADSLPESKEAVEAVSQAFNEDAISRHLFILRTRVGVSQKEMAKRLNVSQSVISKLENRGEYVKFNDAVRYINALEYSAELAFVKGGRSVDFLASYFSRITKMMEQLQAIAGNDPDIAKGVMATFLVFSKSMLEDVIPQLKDKFPRRQSQMEISMAPDDRDTTSTPSAPPRPKLRKVAPSI